jgi:hypothetical protein
MRGGNENRRACARFFVPAARAATHATIAKNPYFIGAFCNVERCARVRSSRMYATLR